MFSSHFSLHWANCKSKESKSAYLWKLNNIIIESSSNTNTAIVVSDASIKNNVTTSIAHIYSYSKSVKKTLHHAINVTMTKAELFAIRCWINQAVQIMDMSHIIITNSIHLANWIFNPSIHLYQQQSIAILKDLRLFFNKQPSNVIEFWNWPSDSKWSLYVAVDNDMKKFNLILISPSKTLWDFSKKEECYNIIRNWQMFFQASDLRGKQFLDLLDDDLHSIELSYKKGGPWIKHLRHSNLLCASATRAILNHAPISEYHLRFFPREYFNCPCREYPIKSRCHILHDCRRFNKYWNPLRDTLSHLTAFLEFNPSAFSFHKGIT